MKNNLESYSYSHADKNLKWIDLEIESSHDQDSVAYKTSITFVGRYTKH